MTSERTSLALFARRRCCHFLTNATATAMDQPAAAWSNVISATSGFTRHAFLGQLEAVPGCVINVVCK